MASSNGVRLGSHAGRSFEQPLAPERALLHPAWWAALALLALNDHVLKGSGVLPSSVTGKLSDFAGLFVAPALLATIFRATQRRTVLGCHLAVGLVFAVLEISPSANHAWGAFLSGLGVPWRTWSDPSDLLALPAVAIAYRLLVRRMEVSRRTPAFKHRLSPLELLGLAVGSFFCLASGTTIPPRHLENGSFVADVFLHVPANMGDHFIEVAMAEPPLDCERLLRDPESVLPNRVFRFKWSGMTRGGWNEPLWPYPGRPPGAESGCAAALIVIRQSTWFDIGADDLPPTYVVWDTTRLPVLPIPRHTEDERTLRTGALVVKELEDELTLVPRGPMRVLRAPSRVAN